MFRIFFNMTLRHHLSLAIAMLGFILALSSLPASAADSQIMPLAAKSLLLDGQVVGDRIIVVGERGHILISEDQGRSWKQQPVPTRATLTSVFFVDKENGWAAGHDSVILRTNDGGSSWREVYADPEDERPILDIWFHDQTTGFAVGAYGLFMETRDSGNSWEPVDFQPATMSAGDETAGDPWDQQEEEVWVDFHLNQIAVTERGRVYLAAEAGNVYRSDDGCCSWLSLPSPYEGSFYGSLPLQDGGLLLYGLRGNLFYSEDAGANWTAVDTGTQATINDGIMLQDGRIALGGLAGTLLISNDHGQNFQLHAQPDRLGIARVLETNDGALILVGEGGARRLELTKEADQ